MKCELRNIFDNKGEGGVLNGKKLEYGHGFARLITAGKERMGRMQRKRREEKSET